MPVHRTMACRNSLGSRPSKKQVPCEEAPNHGNYRAPYSLVMQARVKIACATNNVGWDRIRKAIIIIIIIIMASLCFEVEHVWVGFEAKGLRWSQPCDQLES